MIKRLILKTYEADYDQFDELEQGSLLRLDDLEIKSVSFYYLLCLFSVFNFLAHFVVDEVTSR